MPSNINHTKSHQVPTKAIATPTKDPKDLVSSKTSSDNFKNLLNQKISKNTHKDALNNPSSLHKTPLSAPLETTKSTSIKTEPTKNAPKSPLTKSTNTSNLKQTTPQAPLADEVKTSSKTPLEEPKKSNIPTLKDLLSPNQALSNEPQNKQANTKHNEEQPNKSSQSINIPTTLPLHQKPTNNIPLSTQKAKETPTNPLNTLSNTHNLNTPTSTFKTLKDVDTLAKEHQIKASNLHLSTKQESPKEPQILSTAQKLAPHILNSTPKLSPSNPNQVQNKEASLSSALQAINSKTTTNTPNPKIPSSTKTPLETSDNPPSLKPKNAPTLNESLQTSIVKKAKIPKNAKKSKKKSMTLSQKETKVSKESTSNLALLNTPKTPLLTPMLPLLNNPNANKTMNMPLKDVFKEEEKTSTIENKEKPQETNNTIQNTQPTPISENKSVAPKETIRYFAQQLKQEIQEYKPPMTKISMDLFPKELGRLEVSIQKVGKNLKVSVISHSNNLQTFLDNQQELKNSLSALGFEGIDLSFSQNHSEQQQPNQQEQDPTFLNQQKNASKTYQENHVEEKDTIAPISMQISLYA
ncbi:flagellar hook-length control protein FliK [Helicobacter cetorum]|uniref:flagellar hook-length control protein FliK n=1 Tax=Helicobacter cetorum TaxID=138563 RepID=UPI000CF17A40|nr:flagellar hook-length control protein FliK [Helicobacter cetorum]